MQGYSLPPVPSVDKLILAVKASLALRTLAPQTASCTHYWGPPTGPRVGECAHVDLSLFLAGHTGVFKTELTVIAQSHYKRNVQQAKFAAATGPPTSNALEYQAFQAKDAIFTVDDFVPRGTVIDVQNSIRKPTACLGGRVIGPDVADAPRWEPAALVLP